jgi:hypothetical protein
LATFLPTNRKRRDYAEIEITYKCNLKCINCNRSCAQAPSDLEMPVSDVENFVAQSIEKKLAGDESEFWAESRRSIVVFLISLIVCFVIKRRLTPP